MRQTERFGANKIRSDLVVKLIQLTGKVGGSTLSAPRSSCNSPLRLLHLHSTSHSKEKKYEKTCRSC